MRGDGMAVRVASPGVTYRRCQWCGEDFADYQVDLPPGLRPDSRGRARGNALVAFSGEKPEGQEGLMDRGHFIQDLIAPTRIRIIRRTSSPNCCGTAPNGSGRRQTR